MSPGIIKSPYSKGVYFVKDQEWKVGERYELLHLLGSGSFSSVCCALDTFIGQKVALKRIPDVLSSPELARKVLRETCILRRLRHPFVITLLDAFVTPSSTGVCRMVGGQLVSSSIDVYLSMELGEDGDLFNLRGQLSSEEVRLLMWQLLHALKYLHKLHVWHRDLKSSNVLLTRGEGHKIVKLADFGSSRSATQDGYHWAEQGGPDPESGRLKPAFTKQVIHEQKARRSAPRDGGQGPTDLCDNGVRASDLFVQLGDGDVKGQGVGFSSPLTRVVATPCYRAPEVVMSRGGYTSAIDMWSLGCILGELLQRVPRVGSATTPHLQVAPLFAIHAGILKTPRTGERWDAEDCPGDATTRSELQALFDVIGSPSWADVEDVSSPEWRRYLQRLPGRAPTLFRRFSYAGEVALHLLSRLLAFDPERRCTAEEALAHEYFKGLETDEPDPGWNGQLSVSMEDMVLGTSLPEQLPEAISGLKSQVDAAWEYQAAKKSRLNSPQATQPPRRTAPPPGDGASSRVEACQFEVEGAPSTREDSSLQHFYQEPDAARALMLLEQEMAVGGSGGDDAAQIARLRVLLERECEAQAKQARSRMVLVASGRERRPSPGRTNPLAVWLDPWEKDGLLEDESCHVPDAAKFGQQRLTNIADTWNAKLDTAQHLKPGRHGEWTASTGAGPAAGPRWGVAMIPPGMNPDDPKMRDIMRSQQLR